VSDRRTKGKPEAAAAASPQAPLVIRAAHRADVPRVWEMVHELADYERLGHEVSGSAAALEGDLFAEPARVECVVAETGGALVGYALFYSTYSSFSTAPMMWLEDLFVAPAARGRGAGRALIAEVARRAVARGCRRLGWIVLDWNQPSIEFYQSLGARPAEAGWLQFGFDEATLQALAADPDPPSVGAPPGAP
jgi:GNAT superfamily N-acetyltransferase